jgi:AAA+ ATPase superfamily predicted ATPase
MKPAVLFDRNREWEALADFVADESPGPMLGVVSGRRRQGKSSLLIALCEAFDGFYFGAYQATEAESLRRMSGEWAARKGLPAATRFAYWEDMIDALFDLAGDRPVPIVLDEFPFLVEKSPSLPSIIQHALGPMASQKRRPRLILCGSAMSFMGSLLSGSAPLRGRASFEMVLQTLDYRLAARFWGFTDPKLAALTHSIVGGTPAYGREFVRGDAPASVDDFDSWVCRAVLGANSPLLREARYLLAEEPGLRDPGTYHSVLAAVAEGHNTRGGIANFIGRRSSDLGHPLSVLEDVGFLRQEPDLLRENRSVFRINEPLVTFDYAVMRPTWPRLESGLRDDALTRAIWESQRDRFATAVLGPHFEELCRTWAAHFADPAIFTPIGVAEAPFYVTAGTGTVADPLNKATDQIDVLVMAPPDGERRKVLSIGEAKWGREMGIRDLRRLQDIRDRLAARRDVNAAGARLACYSAAGFTDELRMLGDRGEVLLVGLDDIYGDLTKPL